MVRIKSKARKATLSGKKTFAVKKSARGSRSMTRLHISVVKQKLKFLVAAGDTPDDLLIHRDLERIVSAGHAGPKK